MVKSRVEKAIFSVLAHLGVEENSSSSLVLILLGLICGVLTLLGLIGRFPQAVLVVPLVLLDFECCGGFLHPSGT